MVPVGILGSLEEAEDAVQIVDPERREKARQTGSAISARLAGGHGERVKDGRVRDWRAGQTPPVVGLEFGDAL